MKIILSSNSPRRRELLAGLGIDFEVKVIEGVDESYPDTLPSKDVAEYIAREKAAAYEVADDELFELVHEESVRQQMEVINKQ